MKLSNDILSKVFMTKGFFINQRIKIEHFLYHHKLTYLTYASDLNYSHSYSRSSSHFTLESEYLNLSDKFFKTFSEILFIKNKPSVYDLKLPVFKKEEFLFKSYKR